MKRSPTRRELLVLLAFLALTVVMTWPWALHLRDAANDRLDSYAHAYFLWWGYHQTLHHPLHLFQASIFYPYHYTFAFGENDYGISLICFPLFALGLRPLTVHGLATLIGFAFSGYGMFRLTRTLTASNIAAWIAAIIFAFIPYRFGQLDRLPLVFAGWIPLLFEALILFARKRSWRRAVWLGVAFCMNALTCVTWFVLVLAPLVFSAVFLITRNRLWRERELRLRAGVVLCATALALAPFLLPFYRVSKIYGFARSREEVSMYNVHLLNWLAIVGQNKLWQGLGATINPISELALFPGFLPPLLALAGIILFSPLTRRDSEARKRFPPQLLLACLDALALLSAFIALLVIGYNGFTWRLFGQAIFSVGKPTYALVLLALSLVARWFLTLPKMVRAAKEANWLKTIRSSTGFDALALGLIWTGTGFFGSFGFGFILHRVLYEFIPLFRSVRVAARWSMICYLGLALLAGIGASTLAKMLARRRPRLRQGFTCIAIMLAILFEQRSAPMTLTQGEVEADSLTMRLKQTPMFAGIVDLPAGQTGAGNQRYMLRAADHGRPIVVATNSFTPPLEKEIEEITRNRPIPGRFLDLLEAIPASYVVVHQAFLAPQNRLLIENFLAKATAAGRLRFIRRYDFREGDGLAGYNDLYAVAIIEPEARSEADLPARVSYQDYRPQWQNLPQEFQESGYLVYRLYKTAFRRAPRFDEFVPAVRAIGQAEVVETNDQGRQFTDDAKTFVSEFTNRPAFKAAYGGKTNDRYVDELFANSGINPGPTERDALVQGLNNGAETRATVLQKIADNGDFLLQEFDAAFVLMNYFAYLRRDPDQAGYEFWVSKLSDSGDYSNVSRSFSSSYERKLIATHPWP